MLSGLTEQYKSDREAYLGLMFESVGHVIHHIQDMAQPQHVRNDAHLDSFDQPAFPQTAVVNFPSRYESQTKLREDFLPWDGYDVVKFEGGGPTSFWANGAGTGLANFTNKNFVTHGTNFRSASGVLLPNFIYPAPTPNGSSTARIEDVLKEIGFCPAAAGAVSDKPACSQRGEIEYVSNEIVDARRPGIVEANFRAATYSIFNQKLEAANTEVNQFDSCYGGTTTGKFFSVNMLTFPSAWNFLIPRAVGYSAGMINYFFRGDIDLVPGSAPGMYKLKNNADEPLTGTVRLYYDAEDGKRYPVPGDPWILTNLKKTDDGLPVSNSQVFPVFSVLPKEFGVYTMVFTGTAGGESPIGDSPGAVNQGSSDSVTGVFLVNEHSDFVQ